MEFIMFDLHWLRNIEAHTLFFRRRLAHARTGLRIRAVRADHQPCRENRKRQHFDHAHVEFLLQCLYVSQVADCFS
jgi:hypothetical protein